MFGDNLKKYRTEKELSQSELAEKLFVTRQCVSKWEKNITEPDLKMLSRISEVLEVPVEALLKDVGVAKSPPDYNSRLLVMNVLIAIFSLFAYFALWRFLPKTIPAHWNIAGEIDRYGSRAEVFINFGTTALFAAITVGTYFVLKRTHEVKSAIAFHILMAIFQAAYFIFVVVMYAEYINGVPSFITCIAAAALLCFSAATHPKINKKNYFLGVRTTATLSSAEVWDKTNTLGCYMLAGLSAVIYTVNMCVIFDLSNLCLLSYIIPAVIAKVYSDVIYKRTEKENE